MNEEKRLKYNAKRKRQKKKRKERKKEETRQARTADRRRRIQQEAERILQARAVDQRELVVRAEKERTVKRAVSRVNTTQQQEGPPKKFVPGQGHQHALREISADQIIMKEVHLGSGSYGSCYLGLYRGIDVVVKELRVKQLQRESREQLWSLHTISSSDSKVRTTLNVSITDSGSERDKTLLVPSALVV